MKSVSCSMYIFVFFEYSNSMWGLPWRWRAPDCTLPRARAGRRRVGADDREALARVEELRRHAVALERLRQHRRHLRVGDHEPGVVRHAQSEDFSHDRPGVSAELGLGVKPLLAYKGGRRRCGCATRSRWGRAPA